MNKLMLTVAGALLIGGGAYLNYRMTQQPKEELSDLTLANLEAMALPPDRWDIHGDIYINDPTGRFDCEVSDGNNCGMPVSTPSGNYVEYLVGSTKKPGWA